MSVIPVMSHDDVMAIINAVYPKLAGAQWRRTRLVMSRETVIAVARASAIDLPDDWQPPADAATMIMGTPVVFADAMPFGTYRVVDDDLWSVYY